MRWQGVGVKSHGTFVYVGEVHVQQNAVDADHKLAAKVMTMGNPGSDVDHIGSNECKSVGCCDVCVVVSCLVLWTDFAGVDLFEGGVAQDFIKGNALGSFGFEKAEK